MSCVMFQSGWSPPPTRLFWFSGDELLRSAAYDARY